MPQNYHKSQQLRSVAILNQSQCGFLQNHQVAVVQSGYILSNGLIFIHWIVLVLLIVIQWIVIYLLDWGICPSNNQAQSNYAKWHELMTNSSEYGGVTLQLVNPPLITSHVVTTITLTQEPSSLFIFLYKKHIHL